MDLCEMISCHTDKEDMNPSPDICNKSGQNL